MTKAKILRTLRGLVRNRKRAFDYLKLTARNPKQQALKHLAFYMPKDTWTIQRIARFVCNNREKIEAITPHAERFHKWRKKILEFLNECELLNA